MSTTKMESTSDDDNRNSSSSTLEVDPLYPGTAVARLRAVHGRVKELVASDSLDGPWSEVRRRLLWAGGLRDLTNVAPGLGYTGHAFNDYNHVDLTTMQGAFTFATNDAQNDDQRYVPQIAVGNQLGPGIEAASSTELGPGGSWSTCANGCNASPVPRDVAHLQFRSRIAFKLVWEPATNWTTFCLLDDDGTLLARGRPTGDDLPALSQRQRNYRLVVGSKYATNVRTS